MNTERYGHEIAELRSSRRLDHAWRLGLIGGVRLHQLADRCSRQGNSGVVVLRALLETRPPDYRPTDSGLERRWEEVVGPMASDFRRQIVVGDEYQIGRFDQVHGSRALVVEIHGEAHHTMPSDIERDEATMGTGREEGTPDQRRQEAAGQRRLAPPPSTLMRAPLT